ncbi:MAG TPA: Sec-independent protein translocase protein TatB [Syntrophorhabdales bacterium]|nr:Sec-independent protein translocase protein TatB [Syntrophorhabdales bacterium]
MFGIGIPELVIIVIVALLVVGPAKLPELARSMGKALGEFRRLADDVKETIEHEMAEEPQKDEVKQADVQVEEQKQVQQEEKIQGRQQDVQKGQESLFNDQMLLADGHVVAEQPADVTQTQEQKAEGEAATEGQQVALEDKKEDLAEKIAEGIRINDPQKT